MNYIVMDLEWNQSPGGKEEEIASFPFEIIEIGAVKLDEDRHMVSEFHQTVRPQVYRRLHYKTRELLHISMKELSSSKVFTAVAADFFAWCGEDYMFCTWGSTDLLELQRNMAFYHYRSPLPKPLLYYDAQKMFSLDKEDGKTRRALNSAVEMLKLEENRPFHRALDDAFYTAVVFEKLDMDKVGKYVSVDYFRPPAEKGEEISLSFPEYSKFVSRIYPTKEEAMADKTATAMNCCLCRSLIWRKVRWFPSGQKTYLSLIFCPRHGYVKGKLRVKRTPEGQVFLVRTMKLTDETGAKTIIEKKAETDSRKKSHKAVTSRKKASR